MRHDLKNYAGLQVPTHNETKNNGFRLLPEGRGVGFYLTGT
jgi:hypothetical protein